jgi:hypothetical protein
MAYVVVRVQFHESDFQLFMSHILSVPDPRVKVDLVNLIGELIAAHERLGVLLRRLVLVQSLFAFSSADLFVATLTLVVDAHARGLFPDFPLQAHIDIILHQMSPELVSPALLCLMVDFVGRVPALFPIASWVAVSLGEGAISDRRVQIAPGDHLCSTEFWSIYLVAGLMRASAPLRRALVRFLIRAYLKRMPSLFATIEVVARALNQSADHAKRVVILEYGAVVLESPSLAHKHLMLVHYFLFFGRECRSTVADFAARGPSYDVDCPPSPCGSPKGRRRGRRALRPDTVVFDRETLSEVQERLAAMHLSPQGAAPLHLDEKIREIAGTEFRYTFPLLISCDSEWRDADLAVEAITIVLTTLDQRHLDRVLIITTFLVRSHPDIVQAALERIQIDTASRGVVCLLEHALIAAGLSRRTRLPDADVLAEAFQVMQSIETLAVTLMTTAPLIFLKHWIRFAAANTEMSFDIVTMVDEEFIPLSSCCACAFLQEAHARLRNAEKKWRRY